MSQAIDGCVTTHILYS